jgi:hypothetical protein
LEQNKTTAKNNGPFTFYFLYEASLHKSTRNTLRSPLPSQPSSPKNLLFLSTEKINVKGKTEANQAKNNRKKERKISLDTLEQIRVLTSFASFRLEPKRNFSKTGAPYLQGRGTGN